MFCAFLTTSKPYASSTTSWVHEGTQGIERVYIHVYRALLYPTGLITSSKTV